MNFHDLCRIEPRLRDVEIDALLRTRPDFWRGWEQIKSRMSELVGWDSSKPSLRSSAAYDAAYRYLLDAYELRA